MVRIIVVVPDSRADGPETHEPSLVGEAAGSRDEPSLEEGPTAGSRDERSEHERLVEFYDESYSREGEQAELYARWRALGAKGKADHVTELCAPGRHLARQSTLDVGCGDGALLSELHRRGFGGALARRGDHRRPLCESQRSERRSTRWSCMTAST